MGYWYIEAFLPISIRTFNACTRLIIPKGLRKRVLELAHEGDPGESAMKRRLRVKVWWPHIDLDAKNFKIKIAHLNKANLRLHINAQCHTT